MSYTVWLCIKRIIFFGTTQIFPCLNKVCEKTGKMFFFCLNVCYSPLHQASAIMYSMWPQDDVAQRNPQCT